MNVEGINALREQLGAWIVSFPPEPWDGLSEAELFCPWHEHPAESKKPSATWQPKARSSMYDLGVFHCHRPGCKLPSDGNEVESGWEKAQDDRAAGRESSGNVIDIGAWKRADTPRTKGRATINEPIDGETWDFYKEEMFDEGKAEWFLTERGITAETLRTFDWAWHQGKECYIYPIHRVDGEVEGWRLYDPFHLNGSSPRDKKRWYRTRQHHSNQLYGVEQYRSDDNTVILSEGETDLLLMHQDGITNSVTHTSGAGGWPKEFKEFFTGKTVYTCYDPDDAGKIGREKVAQVLKGIATAVYHIEMPPGLDYSEWRKAGHEPSEFAQLVLDAKEDWTAGPDGLPMDGVPIRSISELKDVTGDRLVSLRAYVAGKATEPHVLPKVARVSCMQNQGKKCDNCPLFRNSRNSEATTDITIRPDEHNDLIAMVGADEPKVYKIVAVIGRLRCDRIDIERAEDWHVEQVSIQDPVDAGNGITSDSRYSAYHFYDSDSRKIEASHDYKMVARRIADPRDQSLTIVSWGAQRTTTDLDTFAVTPAMKEELRAFRPTLRNAKGVRMKLKTKYDDLAANVTKIAQRQSLHFMYDLVAHSVMEFDFNNVHVSRGMLDAIVIGDTRTGKTEVASRLNDWYGIGQIVSGENTSFAGLVGGSAEVTGSRARMPDWGVLPRQHKRMVVIDEVSGLGDLLSKMSSVRSSGIAEVNKQGGGRVPAMVRLLWLGNPAPHDRSNRTRSLREYTNGAADALMDLVKAQEDIARFDLAMAASSADVSSSAINKLRQETVRARYRRQVCHTMVMFAWTRTREQVTFADGVTDLIQHLGERLSRKYAEQPPLVQQANFDQKLARMCVSLATMLYSTDDTGEIVVVRPEHVATIGDFVERCYDDPAFGYGRLSQRVADFRETGEDSRGEFKLYLQGKPIGAFKHLSMEGPALIDHIGTLGVFTVQEFASVTNETDAGSLLIFLSSIGMLKRQGTRFMPSDVMREVMDELENEERVKRHGRTG